MQKILFFIESLGSGGAERVLSVVSNKLINLDCQILILTADERVKPFYNFDSRIQVICLSFNYNKNNFIRLVLEQIRRIKLLRKNIIKFKPDLIFGFLTHCNLRLSLAIAGSKIPLICCEHNNYMALTGFFNRFVRNLIYYFFPKCITVLTDRDVLKYPSILHSKIVVLKNPIGINVSDDCIQYNIMSKNILSVGRLCKQKGFERLLCIFSYLIKDANYKDYKLLIAGDGPEREKLVELADRLGLDKNIQFLGNIKNIEHIYATSVLFAMTSHWEGLPMVLGEAMHMALPLIAYDCPTGPREFIDDGVSGFLVSNGDKDAYIKKLKSMLSNHDLLRKLSLNAREKSKLYYIDLIMQDWLKLINDNK